MRDPDQQRMALECLQLAARTGGDTGDVLLAAEDFYAFVSGDDAAKRLAKVREAVSS